MGTCCEFELLARIDRAPAGPPAETGAGLPVTTAIGVLDSGCGSGPDAARLISTARGASDAIPTAR